MTTYRAESDDLTAVADAIRTKAGTTDKLSWPDGFVSGISNIKTASSSVVVKNQIDTTISAFESERANVKSFVSAAETNYTTDTTYATTIVSNYTGTNGQDIPTGLTLTPTQDGYLYIVNETTGKANERVAVKANTATYVYNLVPGVVYTYMFADSSGAVYKGGRIKDTSKLREINIQNGRNFRDLGGWAAGTSKTVKYGLIIRGGQIENNSGVQITDENKPRFRDLGILEDIDLRSLSEVNKGTADTSDDISSNAAGSYISYIRIEMSNYYDAVNLSGTGYTPTVTVLKRIMSNVVKGIPTYVHCAGGMDRTGTICIILEALLGVSEVDIEIDYELSSFVESRTRDKIKETMDYLKTFNGSTLQEKVVAWAEKAGVTASEIAAYQTAMTGSADTSTDTKNTVKITVQPVDVTTDGSADVTDGVTATGDGLTYAWEWRVTSAGTWTSVSTLGLTATASSITIPMGAITADVNGWQIRCIVTDQYGNSEASSVATLTYKAVASYTNLAGTVASGYALSTSGTLESYAGYITSDYITIPDSKPAGHKIHIGGDGVTWTSATAYDRISFYDSSKAHLKTIPSTRFNTNDYWPTLETVTDKSAAILANLDRQVTNAAYIRISASSTGSSLIITIDEDIT